MDHWHLFSDIEPEVHDIAVLHNILLAFKPHQPFFLGACFTIRGDVIIIGDDFGPDESFFEVASG